MRRRGRAECLLAAAVLVASLCVATAASRNPSGAGSTARVRPNHVEAKPGEVRSVDAALDDLFLPQPAYPNVVRLMKDPGQALAALEREVVARGGTLPPEAAILRAYLLSQARRVQESVPLWDEIGQREESLRIFAQRSAVADLLAVHDVDHAASRVAALVGAQPRPQDDLLLVTLAEAYRLAGQADRAAEIFRDVLRRERQTAVADRARLGLAEAEEAGGRVDSALAVYHEATVTFRSPGTFARARQEERRLAARLQRPVTPLTADQYFAAADRLTAASRYDDAVALLESGRRENLLPQNDKLDAVVVDVLYRGRRNDEAAARAEQFLANHPGSDLAPTIRLLQVRLDIRTNNTTRARKRLDALEGDRSIPLRVLQSARRIVAADLTGTGAARDGLAIYRRLLRSRLSRTDRYDISWRAGIAALRSGDARAAVDMFRQARKAAPSRATPRSTLYWLAVASRRSGASGEAERLWGQLVAENAYDYYGVRASERLARVGMRSNARADQFFPTLQLSEAAKASPELAGARVLAGAGLLDDAASILAAAVSKFRTDSAFALLAARASTAAGDYGTAWSIVSRHFGEFLARPSDAVPADVWQMAFPRAFWSEVEPAATKNGIDPLLLLSLMRRESRFIATARSRTGALGLFQIMPYTAREITQGEEATESDRLTDAPASAELAARLVKRITARFGGATAPVVASYNAGEDRVETWWKASAGIDEDLFVDSIPYGETRQYVREVLANYATYRRLYGGK